MKKLLLLILVISTCSCYSQLSLSTGFAWSNEPFNPDGYALNADLSIAIDKNEKWFFKPNVGYKNMKNYDDYLLAELQNQAFTINSTFGYNATSKGKYKMITYLGPSIRWNKFWGKLDNPNLNIWTKGPDSTYGTFSLTIDEPENEISFWGFGYAIQIENQFKFGETQLSFVPFLEPDISFDPKSGGFYISYYFN